MHYLHIREMVLTSKPFHIPQIGNAKLTNPVSLCNVENLGGLEACTLFVRRMQLVRCFLLSRAPPWQMPHTLNTIEP